MQKSRLLFTALVLAGSIGGAVGTTHADPPGGSGWDENPDIVVGGGSDTTYLVVQRLETLYNTAPGCAINLAEAAGKADCIASPGVPSGPTNGNYDHDLLVGATPTGSSAGVDALRVGMAGAPAGLNQYTPPIDYARSSSGPSGTRLDNLTYWGYARDAIIVVSFGARTNLCITQAQLQGVYNLTITLWNQLTDCNGNPMPNVDADPTTNDPIIPWAMNGSSGTNASFNTFVSPTNTATNGRRLKATNLAPFENDVKPLLGDAGPDNVVGNADDDENNYLWWMSYANYFTYAFTKNGCANGVGVYSPSANTCSLGGTVVPSNPVGVQNLTTLAYVQPSAATINNSSYPITRTVYHVTRNTEADCRVAPGTAGACDNAANTVYGATSGKGGAVREFTQWLCKAAGSPSHAINVVTGRDYRTEIVRALNAEGFQQTSTNSTGYRCSVST